MTDSLGPSVPPSAPPTAPFSSPPKGGGRGSGLLLGGCGLFVLLAVIGVVALVVANRKKVSVDDQTVLRLNLSGVINERVAENPVADFFGRRELTVLDYRSMLRKAGVDKRVKGVVLRLEPLGVGWAKIEEIRDALVEFKKSGKWLYVYAEFLTEKEYALALPADEIIMPPDAPFEFNGIASEVMHYPGLLEKLGVEVQYFRFGKYKSVSGESFGRKALSEPVKEMINENLDRVFDHFAASVAQFRKLEALQVKALVDEQGLKSTWALEKKLIDRLAYWDEVESLVKDKVKPSSGEVTYVNAAKYAQVSASSAGLKEGKHSIGLVYSQGLIVAGRGSDDQQGSDSIIKALRKGVEDEDIKAIVFRVDSPGGAGLGCDYVRREIERAREKKPVIVSMSDVAASGGYWVSMDATAIVAQPTTATGSIGIFAVVPNLAGTYEKLGLNNEVFARGAHADSLMGSRAMREDEAKHFDDDLHVSYDRFVALAAKGRKKTVDEMEPLAQGRTWYGDKALELGLVDKLGGFDTAFALAKEKAGLPLDELVKVVPLERPRSWLEQLADPEAQNEQTLTRSVRDAVLRALGMPQLLQRVPGLRGLVQGVLVDRQTVFPMSEYALDPR